METYGKPITGISNDSQESALRYGGSASFSFSLVVETEGELQAIDGFTSCRESLIEKMNKRISSEKIPTDKVRILFILGKEGWPRLSNTRRILNLYDDFAGFSKTDIYKCKLKSTYDRKGEAEQFYHLIIGSRRWIKSSYMLSLFMQMLRVGVKSSCFEDEDFESLQAFEKKINSIISKASSNTLSDFSYLKYDFKHWRKFLKGYSVLFGKHTIKKNWSIGHWKINSSQIDTFRYEGIHCLLGRDSYNHKLKEAFSKLKED